MHLRLAAGGVVLASGGRCGGRRVGTGLEPGQRDLGQPLGLALVVASPLPLKTLVTTINTKATDPIAGYWFLISSKVTHKEQAHVGLKPIK